MSVGNRKRIFVLTLFLAVVIILTGFQSYAQSEGVKAVKLSLEQATAMALSYSHSVAETDKNIKDLWEQHNSLQEAANAIDQQLNTIDRINYLYDKERKNEAFTLDEVFELQGYRMIYGSNPPKFTDEERFHNFIKNRDYPVYSIWASIQNLTVLKELNKAAISVGVRQLFSGVLDMQEGLELQKGLYENMKKQNGQMLLKHKAGQVSDLERYQSETGLEKQKLAVAKMERCYDSLLMSLKKMIGLPLTQKIELEPLNCLIPTERLKDYDFYVNKALQARYEVITAKMDLKVKQRELDIMKQYIKDELSDEFVNAKMAVDEKQIGYDLAMDSVRKDIYYAYTQAKNKLDEIDVSRAKLGNAQQQYDNALKMYQQGNMSLTDFWNIQLSLTQAQYTCNKSVRDYNNSFYYLGQACALGPAARS